MCGRARPGRERRERTEVTAEVMRYDVPPEACGLRLGQFLFDRLKLSRTLVRRAKGAGGVLVDGLPARTSQVLRGGEVVEIRVDLEGRVEPEPVPLAIVYEDGSLLVVDKPAGMVVHPVREHVSAPWPTGWPTIFFSRASHR